MVAMTTLAPPTLDLFEAQHSDSTIGQLISWKQANTRKPKLQNRPTDPKLRCLPMGQIGSEQWDIDVAIDTYKWWISQAANCPTN